MRQLAGPQGAGTCSGKLGRFPDQPSSCSTGLWPRGGGWKPGPDPAGWEPGLPLPDNWHTQVPPCARCLLSHMLSALSAQEVEIQHIK